MHLSECHCLFPFLVEVVTFLALGVSWVSILFWIFHILYYETLDSV